MRPTSHNYWSLKKKCFVIILNLNFRQKKSKLKFKEIHLWTLCQLEIPSTSCFALCPCLSQPLNMTHSKLFFLHLCLCQFLSTFCVHSWHTNLSCAHADHFTWFILNCKLNNSSFLSYFPFLLVCLALFFLTFSISSFLPSLLSVSQFCRRSLLFCLYTTACIYQFIRPWVRCTADVV